MTEYKIGDVIEVTIKKIVPKGLGLAFAENLTVFVPLSAAGDTLRVRIDQLKGKTAFAEIEQIMEPGPERIAAPCVYFGRCGGCDFQQLGYQTQLKTKVGMIRDCLERIGKISYENEIPIIASPKEFGYRTRAMWHLDTRQKKLGYFKRNSHEVIDIENCPILTPRLEKKLKELRSGIEWEKFWGERAEIEASCGDGDSVSVYSPEIMEPTDDISFTVNGEKYIYSAQSFFQGNQFLIEQLLETALSGAEGETALDLYCGVGLFTLPLARRFKNVIGVEENEKAIEFAEKNVKKAGLENVRLIHDSVDSFLSGHDLSNTDFILLDPPRAGTAKRTILKIIAVAPRNISYVSCEPSILARDLRYFLDRGYEIESLTAIDLFPQTHHVETIARLKRI